MKKFRSGLCLIASLLAAPLAQAHPGHESHDSGLFASLVHSIVTLDLTLILFALAVGYGLWTVARRVTRRLGITRAGSRWTQ